MSGKMIINVIPPEPTPEEKKAALLKELKEIMQQIFQLGVRPDLDLINLSWNINVPSDIQTHIEELVKAIQQCKKKIDAIEQAKKVAALNDLISQAYVLIGEAKQMRTTLRGSIADESQTRLLDLRLTLEVALRAEEPIASDIRKAMNELADFVKAPRTLEDSPELKRRMLPK